MDSGAPQSYTWRDVRCSYEQRSAGGGTRGSKPVEVEVRMRGGGGGGGVFVVPWGREGGLLVVEMSGVMRGEGCDGGKGLYR